MRKLYIFIDDWKTNKVFIGKELELLSPQYDTTVICDDVDNTNCQNVKFIVYHRKITFFALIYAVVRLLFDLDVWKEIASIKGKISGCIKKLSEVIRFYLNAQFFYLFLKKEILIKKESDSIFYSYWYFWKCFAITNHKKKYPNIKIISRTHGYELYNEQLKSNWQPFKRAMDLSLDRLIFVSDYGQEYYFSTFHVMPDSKHLIYSLGTENPYGVQSYCKKNIFHIVSCSGLIPLKRVDLIIESLALIDEIDIIWTHFGTGDCEESLKELASRLLDKKSNIKYSFNGYTENDKILEFYHLHQIDLFITTTESEGGNPVSIQEAMSFGIPIMATSICNLPRMIDENGVLLPEMPSPDKIAEEIRKFNYLSETQIVKMRLKSRALWEKNYIASKNYRKFVEEVIYTL